MDPRPGRRLVQHLMHTAVFGKLDDRLEKRFALSLQKDVEKAQTQLRNYKNSHDRKQGVKTALAYGEAGAAFFLPDLRKILGDNYERPKMIDLCLQAIQKQGLIAVGSLQEVAPLCGYEHKMASENEVGKIRQRAMDVVLQFGIKILEQKEQEFLPELELAVPHILNTWERNPETIRTALTTFCILGRMAIAENMAMGDFFMKNISSVSFYTQAPFDDIVNGMAQRTARQLSGAANSYNYGGEIYGSVKPPMARQPQVS